AAGWLRPVEEDRHSLVIATPVVDEKGPTEAYRLVYGDLRELGKVWLTDSEIKLVGEKNALTRLLLESQRRLTAMPPTLPEGFPPWGGSLRNSTSSGPTTVPPRTRNWMMGKSNCLRIFTIESIHCPWMICLTPARWSRFTALSARSRG